MLIYFGGPTDRIRYVIRFARIYAEPTTMAVEGGGGARYPRVLHFSCNFKGKKNLYMKSTTNSRKRDIPEKE